MKDGAERRGETFLSLKLATSAAGANRQGGGNQHFYFPAQSPAGWSVAVWQPYKPQLSSAHKPQSENQLGLTDGTFGLSSLA